MKTIIKGKEVKLYGKKDISKFFSDKVAEYLSNGYVFNTLSESSRGSQGEDTKVTLTNDNGKTVLIIYLYRQGSIMLFKAEKFKVIGTCWLGKGEEILKKEFYQINYLRESYSEKSVFCENKEDADAVVQIEFDRYKTRKSDFYDTCKVKNPKMQNIILKIIKKKKGYKTTEMTDIANIYKDDYKYTVTFNDYKKCSIAIALNKGERR